ncbi:MAG: formyltransferase family protein [Oligoflexales bacterium]
MRNIAIFNIDSHASALAIQDILIKHCDEIKLLVLSKPIAAQKKSFLKEVLNHLKISGLSYVNYLTANFLIHPHMCRAAEIHGKIFNKKPRMRHLETLCTELGIQCIRTDNVNSLKIQTLLKEKNIDLVTVYYFDQILKKRLLSAPKKGTINFHAAVLPHCRGLHPIIWSIIQNQPFGLSAHTIPDARIDAGPILAQTQVLSQNERHILSLEQHVNQAGVSLYSDVIQNLDVFMKEAQEQAKGSYFSHPKKSDLLRLKRQGFQLIRWRSWFKGYFTPSMPLSTYKKRTSGFMNFVKNT